MYYEKIKRAYILLFVCVMTVCFSGCQNQSNVSSEDVENSLFMEWCSRFRASNEPLILITFPDGTSTSLVGENAVTAASDMEKALAALTADDFLFCKIVLHPQMLLTLSSPTI